MTTLSTARKLSILGRVVWQQASRNRTVGALVHGGKIAVLHVGRVLHQLWLQVTGFVFLSIALISGFALRREWVQYHADSSRSGRVVLAAAVTLMFLWFGLSSFWRAARRR